MKEWSYFKNEHDSIYLNWEYGDPQVFAPGKSTEYRQVKHGPLLEYNPPLLLAIAGQRQEGGVGCWYSNGQGELFCYLSDSENGTQIVAKSPNGVEFMLDKNVLRFTDLATIEELIEAFPNEEGVYQNPEQVGPEEFTDEIKDGWAKGRSPELTEFEQKVLNETFKKSLRSEPTLRKPEPRKIKKGDRLLCVKRYSTDIELTVGNHYTALIDENFDYVKSGSVKIIGNNCEVYSILSDCFIIANEEEPVKEERNWTEAAVMMFSGEALVCTITSSGIQIDNSGKDITEFLRAVLAKYEELRSK